MLESGAVHETLPVDSVVLLIELAGVEPWRRWMVLERVMDIHEEFAQTGRRLSKVKAQRKLAELKAMRNG